MYEYPLSHHSFADDPEYHQEMAVLRAQERICEVMAAKGVNKADLAKRLNKSKAFVSRLLAEGHNMTIKTFADVLFHLGEEARFDSEPIHKTAPVFAFPEAPKLTMRTHILPPNELTA